MAKSKRKRTKVNTSRLAHEAEGGALGAVAGTAIGMIAGPPGMVAGAVIGAFAGALSGAVIDGDTRRDDAHTRELDEELGVEGGELGAPGLKHPPPTRGTYSAASLGVGVLSEEEPAEGPVQAPPD
jgi:hypothetical protein